MEQTTKKKSMKKKVLAGTSLALVASVAVAGTIAYLTDTDSDVNVMTLGNVDIEQIEQERDATGALTDFTQAKPLYPAYYEDDSIPWDDSANWVIPDEQAWKVVEENENVIDKFVTVKNTGKSDAYVRTVFAFEAGTLKNTEFIHIVTNATNVPDEIDSWDWLDETVTIDGINYELAVATYKKALAPGETSIPSLKQVYLDKKATNEYCASFGDTYDILVVSQAVQTAGFSDAETALNEAFGEITATNHPWVTDTSWYDAEEDEYTLTSAEDLIGFSELVNSGTSFAGKTVKLDADINLAGREWIPIGQTGSTTFAGVFDGQGHTISNLTVDSTDETGEYYATALFGWVENHGSLPHAIKNVKVDNANITGGHNVGVIAGWTNTEISGCVVTNSTINGVYAASGEDGNKVGVIAGYADGSSCIITGNTVKDCKVSAGRDAGQVVGAAKTSAVSGNTISNVTVTDGAFSTGANINNAEIGRVL